jgi:hypothetical protein
VHPASPEPRFPPPGAPGTPYDVDARAAIDAVLEPLRAETDRVDREVRDNAAFLEQRRRDRIDPDTRRLLDRAADSPDAPDSLRRLARRVSSGEIGWDDVFARRVGPDGDAFLAEAFRTARQHFGDADLPRVSVPEAALETGVDPDDVADDIERTRREARADHDAVFRRTFEGPL